MEESGRAALSAIREIERPLGVDGPARKRSARRRWNLSPATLLTTVTVVAISAASGMIAFRDSPFRMPAPSVVSTPEVETLSGTDAQAPSIIRVESSSGASDSGSVAAIRDPGMVRQELRVAHLPDRALLEDGPHGPLPIRAADGRRPFDVYARPWSGARGARVALVIGGLGVSQTGTQEAIRKLPPQVTLAFASGGNSLSRWMQSARQEGHEIVMQVPFEPFDYPRVNPGRATLLAEAATAENLDSLHWTLARTTNYVGVMNYMGARFTADEAAMAPVMADLGKRGLLYFDDGLSARSLAEPMSKTNGVPFAASDLVIDGVRERGDILKKLDELERTARAQGYAVGTGSAFDITVDAVVSWAAEARQRGIEIVPISAVANDPERR